MAALADAVLVGTGAVGSANLAAYEPSTLAERWRFTTADLAAEPLACASLICLETTRLVRVVDPRTGSLLWQNRGPTLRPTLQAGLLLATGSGEQLELFEARTGRAVRTSGRWRMVDTSGYDPNAVVARTTVDARADLAVLALTTGTLRRLGSVNAWSLASRCQVAREHVACEDEDTVRVWRAMALSPPT